MTFTIELEQEDDGRWLAEVPALPGVLCHGADRDVLWARPPAIAVSMTLPSNAAGPSGWNCAQDATTTSPP